MAPRPGSMSPRPPKPRASTSAIRAPRPPSSTISMPPIFAPSRPRSRRPGAAHLPRTACRPAATRRLPPACRGRRGGGQLEVVGHRPAWPSPSLPLGARVVLSPNHVGFFSGLEGDRVYLLGGNQSDRVDRTPFPRSQVVAARWLNLAPAQSMAGGAPKAGATVGHAYNRAVGGLSRQARGRWNPATTMAR